MGEGQGAGRELRRQPAAPGSRAGCILTSPARFRAPKAMLLSEQAKRWGSCLYPHSSQLEFNSQEGDQAPAQEEARRLQACRERGDGGGTMVPLASTTLWENCPRPQGFSCAHSEQGAPSVHSSQHAPPSSPGGARSTEEAAHGQLGNVWML